MALLEMVNEVRGKLREERIGAIVSADLLTTEVISLLNDAASEILEENDWPFDLRTDGAMFWPAKQSGTNGSFGFTGTIYENERTAILSFSGDTDAGEVFEDTDLAGFRMSDPFRSRIIPTGSEFANTSWGIESILSAGGVFALELKDNLYFTPVSGAAWTSYVNEQVLPTTVREVLSVRNEERDIPVEFVNRDVRFDNVVPRPHVWFNDETEAIFIGSFVTSTARTGPGWTTIGTVAATSGTGAMIWPVPENDLHLQYNYRVQHSDLVADTDSFANVPKDVIHLIEWRALQMAHQTGIQNDPKLAVIVDKQVERRLIRALSSATAQPNRRRVPTEFRQHGHFNTRRRWASQVTPTP